MASENLLPEKPLDFIQRCIKEQKIFWTYHVNMRMKGRFIPRQFILESVNNYEIIELYEKDKYFPSYLVYSKYKGNAFHVLFAIDVKDDNVRIITTYYPNLEEWEKDLKTRRRPK
jgi:hypothetical protein